MSKYSDNAGDKKRRPEVFRYHDYREYLKDWLAYCKAGQSSLSCRSISAKAGMSVSNLSMILSGSRKLSSKVLFKLAPALGLNRQEHEYLETLVLLGNANSQEERVVALERMNRSRAYRNRNHNESAVYRYLTHWYYVAIREMSALPGFKADAEWIRPRLNVPVSLKEIEIALSFLIEHKYIETLPDGSIRPPSKPLDCMSGVYRMALIQFHREMLALAGNSIDIVPSEKRNILGYSLIVDPGKFEKIQSVLSKAYDEIRLISQEEGPSESVYHVALAFFPLTKV
jgi:uncharacterized protein (TIGR02147 family)